MFSPTDYEFSDNQLTPPHTHTQFSTQFEIYEQHCALEFINLRSLNKAMKMTDFKTYLEVGGPAKLMEMHTLL